MTRIGFTSREENIDYFIRWQRDYWFCLQLAGAEPVRLYPEAVHDYHAALDGLDGLLLTGGGDIDPAQYGQPIDGTDPDTIYPERDRMELGLARAAVERGLPVFGICRGIQVMNVALGGCLIQHVEGHTGKNNTFEQPKPHLVRLQPDSLIERVMANGPKVLTNSYHHQALCVDGLAPGLVATGFAEDGTVEVVEMPDHPWFLGVQWHPERLYELGPEHRRLFEAFAAAARRA